MNEISRSNVFRSAVSESEATRAARSRARLRDNVAELMLEIQELREALGYPESEIRPR